jgi:hypothetical protein
VSDAASRFSAKGCCVNLAVLIGAGASFGAGGTGPQRPPRGVELFGRLEDAFPDSWGALLDDEERKVFDGDPPFESGMKMLWDKGGQQVRRLIIDMAIYFSRFHPDPSPNCYAALLRLLMSTRSISVFFCSLNYECVFEQIAEQVGLDLINLGRGRSEGGQRACLYKPHGSCNYMSRMARNMRGVVMGDSPHDIYYEQPSPSDLEVVDCPCGLWAVRRMTLTPGLRRRLETGLCIWLPPSSRPSPYFSAGWLQS